MPGSSNDRVQVRPERTLVHKDKQLPADSEDRAMNKPMTNTYKWFWVIALLFEVVLIYCSFDFICSYYIQQKFKLTFCGKEIYIYIHVIYTESNIYGHSKATSSAKA